MVGGGSGGPQRPEGPCGNTTVTESEINAARHMFEQQLPSATSGLSIVQRLAGAASSRTPAKTLFSDHSPPASRVRDGSGGLDSSSPHRGSTVNNSHAAGAMTMSQRVVNSHLEYFRKFAPFAEGRFTKDTLYQFLFFAVVESRVRMSYAKRVLRNILSYVRRYLEVNGSDRVVVVIEKTGGRTVTLNVKLTPESMAFFRDNPRGNVVQSRLFYRLMNSVGEQTNNQRLKNIVCEARRCRDLVFSEEQNATLMAFVFQTLWFFVEKYMHRRSAYTFSTVGSASRNVRVEETLRSLVSAGLTANATRRDIDTDRVVFEFCVAHLLGFLTGARIKSTIMRLTVAEVDRLIRGETIEKLTKGSFVRLFIPERLRYRPLSMPAGGPERVRFQQGIGSTFDPRDDKLVAALLHGLTVVRRDPLLYAAVRVCKHIGGGGECGYGVYRQCRNKTSSTTYLRASDCSSDESSSGERVCRAKTGRLSLNCPYGSGECAHKLSNAASARADATEQQLFFLSGGRQLDYTFNRIFLKLFREQRPKGVFWHSQRRRYLGAVNEKFGAVTASKSVGHADVETTMMYINKSMHREDTNRRAGSAVYDEMMRLVSNGSNTI